MGRTASPAGTPGRGAPAVGALVLSDTPERVRLRELQRALSERRDTIAELDLEIEVLRDELTAFEQQYQARLAIEHAELKRIESYVRHCERWADLLRSRPAQTLAKQAARVERRRDRDVRQSARGREREGRPAARAPEVEAAARAATAPTGPTKSERLKIAYRALARRYHPDLARTEEEQLRFGQLMARINALYRAQDLERLLALEEQAKGGEVEDGELSVEEQLEVLAQRLAWFDAVQGNLREERAALERSPTCELWRNVEQAAAVGRDLIEELREELRRRVERSYADICDAARRLERDVGKYNREGASLPEARPRAGALEQRFDPYADKSLVRLGLTQLNSASASRAAREQAEALEHMAEAQPGVLRVILLTYSSELSPFPLTGLESYDAIAQRYEHLAGEDAAPLSLEQALLEADAWVQYGVKQATPKVAYVGLRFRNDRIREAVPVALERPAVRRELARILGVLGEYVPCKGCGESVYVVPLYRTRGLDDLRASVCPSCGETHSSYWMPKGKDVQAVLNSAYLDYELVTEWSFELAHLSIATQLLPVQVESYTVGELKKRFCADTFERHGVEVGRAQVQLWQGSKKLSERTPLADLDEQRFLVRFVEGTKLDERDALELIRHRIRTRFKSGR